MSDFKIFFNHGEGITMKYNSRIRLFIGIPWDQISKYSSTIVKVWLWNKTVELGFPEAFFLKRSKKSSFKFSSTMVKVWILINIVKLGYSEVLQKIWFWIFFHHGEGITMKKYSRNRIFSKNVYQYLSSQSEGYEWLFYSDHIFLFSVFADMIHWHANNWQTKRKKCAVKKIHI